MLENATYSVAEHSFRLQPSIKLHAPVTTSMFSCSSTDLFSTLEGWKCISPVNWSSLIAYWHPLSTWTGAARFMIASCSNYCATTNASCLSSESLGIDMVVSFIRMARLHWKHVGQWMSKFVVESSVGTDRMTSANEEEHKMLSDQFCLSQDSSIFIIYNFLCFNLDYVKLATSCCVSGSQKWNK